MARQLSGKEVASSLNERIREKAANLSRHGVSPTLAFIRVGEREEDISYEKGVIKRFQLLGISYEKYVLEGDCTQEQLMDALGQANENPKIHGILLFRPLPDHLDEEAALALLKPEKDVDGVTEKSMFGVFAGRDQGFPPCTAQACMEILDYYGINCIGKRAVVIGRSLVVGRPAAMMLLGRHATVTVCHTRTKDMPSVAREADLLIVAAGKAGIVDSTFLRKGQVVIDVGIHVDEKGKLCGDVDYQEAERLVDMITPVPGGVGVVTTSVLADHVVEAALRQEGLSELSQIELCQQS